MASFCLIVYALMIFVSRADAAVIFSENYEMLNGYNCGTTPPNWSNWSSCNDSATYNGVFHYAGEINSGAGRNGTAGLQIWRNNGGDADGSYAGALARVLSSDEFANNYKELYTRFYLKIPAEWDYSDGYVGEKLNRSYIGTYAGDDSAGQWSVMLGANSSTGHLRDGYLDLYIIDGTAGSWYSSQTINQLGLADGNWHCFELRSKIDTSSGGFTIWIDGTVIETCDGSGLNCATNHSNLNTGASDHYFSKLLTPAVGNVTGATWSFPSNIWYAASFDDYVVSTTYIGPESSDTTPPATPSGLAVS